MGWGDTGGALVDEDRSKMGSVVLGQGDGAICQRVDAVCAVTGSWRVHREATWLALMAVPDLL